MEISYHLIHFNTSIADRSEIESDLPLEITFASLSATNIYYGPLGKLLEGFFPAFQIITKSVIATHYGKYGKLLEGPKNQLILDNDEIVGDVEDEKTVEDARNTRKAKDVEDARKTENVGNKKNTRDAREAKNVRDARDAGNVRDIKARRGNDKAANRRN